jgi:pimeloyl-ACP methyl ester carboxylesterase
MQEAWVVHQSARLPVSEVGAGLPMVFIHAGVADRRSWYDVMAIVGASRRAVAYDRRGYGDSVYEPEAFSPVDDLRAVLDDRGIDRAVLVGCSNGGQIAYEATFVLPDRVEALVLVDSAPQGAPMGDLGPALEELAAAIDEADVAGDLDRVNELEARLWLDGPETPAGRVTGPPRELFMAMNGRALRAEPVGDDAPMTATWDQLADVAVPTLVIVGSLDLPHVVDRARTMADVIPDAGLVVIDGAAHLPMLERPSLIATELLDFTARLDPGPGRPPASAET